MLDTASPHLPVSAAPPFGAGRSVGLPAANRLAWPRIRDLCEEPSCRARSLENLLVAAVRSVRTVVAPVVEVVATVVAVFVVVVAHVLLKGSAHPPPQGFRPPPCVFVFCFWGWGEVGWGSERSSVCLICLSGLSHCLSVSLLSVERVSDGVGFFGGWLTPKQISACVVSVCLSVCSVEPYSFNNKYS